MAIVSIQRGQTNIASGTSSATAAITAVTLANAWVNVIGVRGASTDGLDEWRRQQVDAELNSTTQITFRTASPNDITGGQTVEWEVIEDDELSVQRGRLSGTPANNPGTNNVTITAVTLASTWVCAWAAGDGGSDSEFFFPTVRLSSTTNLQLVHDDASFSVSWSWQVIEDTGSRLTVQRFNGTLGTGTTVDVTISAVVLANSWVRGYAFRSGSGLVIDADTDVHLFLQATTTLRWERSTTAPSSWDYTAEVIESTEVDVQRAQITFGANATVNSTISAVTMAESFVMLGQSYTANARSNTAGDVLNSDINTSSLTSTTNVQGQRASSSSNGVLSRFEVVSESIATAVPLIGKRPVNPVRPVLQKNHPLAQGLVFSVCFGWTKGYRANEDEDLAPDDRTKRRGDIEGSKAGTFGVNRLGRQNNGGTSDDRLQWENGPNNQLGNIDTVFGTVMLTFQPDQDTAATEAGVFTKRDNGGSTSTGWSINTDLVNGDDYELEYSDGASNADSNSNGNAPLDGRYPQILAGRFRGTDDANEFIDLWMDGYRRGIQTSVPMTGTPSNFNNVEIFGYDAADGLFGQINMGAVYDRALPVSAIQQHNIDPYVIWRSREARRFFEGPGGIVGYNTYFLSF